MAQPHDIDLAVKSDLLLSSDSAAGLSDEAGSREEASSGAAGPDGGRVVGKNRGYLDQSKKETNQSISTRSM